MLRAFVAVEIPPELAAALGALQAELAARRVRARWVAPGNIHLTLKFLGRVPAGHAAAILAALAGAARPVAPFALRAAGVGVFPDLRRPRVLWAGVAGETAALAGLHQRVEEALAALAFPREARRFRGHLTIGRFPEGAAAGVPAEALKQHAHTLFGELPVRELVLFQSDLQPKGPVYTALGRAPLAGAP
jgi:2'-5' RNA ligase